MKKYVMAFALFFAMSYVFAQDVKGYYIGIGGQRVEVLFAKQTTAILKGWNSAKQKTMRMYRYSPK